VGVEISVCGSYVTVNGRGLGPVGAWRMRRGLRRWNDRVVSEYLAKKAEIETNQILAEYERLAA
jgi:hypothetical protein